VQICENARTVLVRAFSRPLIFKPGANLPRRFIVALTRLGINLSGKRCVVVSSLVVFHAIRPADPRTYAGSLVEYAGEERTTKYESQLQN